MSDDPFDRPATEADALSFGLKTDEYAQVLAILGRTPNLTELGVFSVMWSEHCSYKSSKLHLKTLPTEAPWVIQGPGENAGVIDIGDGDAAIFKIESHNHPSFIEPYQGAATGVGGILRDVFTMGARPVANLNALRFGDPAHPRTHALVAGVTAGIGGYGNCVGVPTVAGEVNFHPAYNGNILVNAMTVGLAKTDRIFYSAAAGLGNPVVYVGAKTGRDGIHGATMASAEFNEDSEKKRPTVQVGDPFLEKLLIEACLELMATDAIVAIQDMGAAGLTSSSVEMAGKGGLGIELDLDHVPLRETNMSAYEIMLSESQERMLMVLKPGHEGEAEAIFRRWGLDFATIGTLTDTGKLVLKRFGKIAAELPIAPISAAAPEYDRPWVPTPRRPVIAASDLNPRTSVREALLTLLGGPDLCSRRWIWEQYDHLVQGNTVQRPGGDSALVRVDGQAKGLAVTVDCTPRYCLADPYLGGMQAVAETWRNITATGAKPLAATNNLNFGNPERPEVMGQLVGAIAGIGAACRALEYPIVSGNVSLYNETNGQAILPTPVIGGVGLIADCSHSVGIGFKSDHAALILVGETKGWLGCSVWLKTLLAREDGAPPPVDLAAERRNGDAVRNLIGLGLVEACHDVADGGLLVAVVEMAMAGGLGATLSPPPAGLHLHGWCFGEDQGRYLLATTQADAVLAALAQAGVPAAQIGTVGGVTITLPDGEAAPLAELREAYEQWLPSYMERTPGA